MGVYHADCLRRIIKSSVIQGLPFNAIWGFDSFAGLPEESDKISWRNPDWPEGAFSVMTDYHLATPEACIQFATERVYEVVDRHKCPPLNFVSGFFDKSLTPELGKNLQNSCSFLHLDVDLYISSIQCFEWLFKYSVLKEGALLRMDDWLYNGQWAGNNRAYAEITNRFEVNWIDIADNVKVYRGHTPC